MKYENLKFVAKQYKHGWSVWIKADSKSMLIGSGIKNQIEIDKLIKNIDIELEPLLSRKEQQKLLSEVEELRAYREKYENLKSKIDSLSSPVVYERDMGNRLDSIF